MMKHRFKVGDFVTLIPELDINKIENITAIIGETYTVLELIDDETSPKIRIDVDSINLYEKRFKLSKKHYFNLEMKEILNGK